MIRLEVALRRLARAVTCCGLAGLVMIALFILAEGLARWVLGITFPGLQDVVRVALPVIVGATFPAALLGRQHITVRFAGSFLGDRAGRALDFLGAVVLLACLAGISQQLYAYAADARANADATWTLQLPLAPTYYAASLLIGLSAVAQSLVIVRDALAQAARSGTAGDVA